MRLINYLGVQILGELHTKSQVYGSISESLELSTSVELRKLVGFLRFVVSFLANHGRKLLPFHCCIVQHPIIATTDDDLDCLTTLICHFERSMNPTLRLAERGLRYVILCDANIHGTGFILTIDGYLLDKDGNEKTSSFVFFSG